MGTIWKDKQLLDWSSQLYHSKKKSTHWDQNSFQNSLTEFY